MNVYHYVRYSAGRVPDAVAVRRPHGEDVTYRDIDRRAQRVAAWVDSQGMADDARIAVFLPDCAAYASVVLGIWRAGRVAAPLNARFGTDELTYTLTDLDPSALVTADAFADRTAAIHDAVDALDADSTVTAVSGGVFDERAFPDAESVPASDPVTRLDEEPAVVMYTSGTTGRPKGVVQTHRNVTANVQCGITTFDYTEDDVAVAAVPMFHVGGLYGVMLPILAVGAEFAILDAWDAARWAELVEETGATLTGLIPTMMVDAVNTPEAVERDTSSLERVFYGGAPATVATLDAFEEAFDCAALLDYYGQTENTGVSVTFDESTERKPALLGYPMDSVRARVVDFTTGDDVPTGEQGELLLKGDVITPGYWNVPERTEEAFTEHDGRRWLHTGDVVRRDDEGLLYYVDRVDDIVLTGGEKVAPTAVEEALQAMPGVAAVAVFGTDHERWGEAVTAAIVPGEAGLTEEDVLDYWEREVDLAGYQKPRRVVFRESFPRTATQKVDKVALAEDVGSGG
ncbi:class I adenylate-forming enzyme family protein [Halomarina oriensis]|uniref:AMP-binding protein n=1 Tax=Halomarina oriensis TaxID=671145 RepID=A0A6B0GKJ1_9EURY|nr:class I adenylate-forming enzyme family protein [Halomarina oriensis]MWG33939.1 AMP-binding protein [Halomarina oriensis]